MLTTRRRQRLWAIVVVGIFLLVFLQLRPSKKKEEAIRMMMRPTTSTTRSHANNNHSENHTTTTTRHEEENERTVLLSSGGGENTTTNDLHHKWSTPKMTTNHSASVVTPLTTNHTTTTPTILDDDSSNRKERQKPQPPTTIMNTTNHSTKVTTTTTTTGDIPNNRIGQNNSNNDNGDGNQTLPLLTWNDPNNKVISTTTTTSTTRTTPQKTILCPMATAADLMCPSFPEFLGACSSASVNVSKGGGGLSISEIQNLVGEPEALAQSLYQLFHNKRVVMVGDSMTRQWYETLTCRLGLQKWFFPATNPQSIQRLTNVREKAKISIDPFRVTPRGIGRRAEGYSIATTDQTLLKNHFPLDDIYPNNITAFFGNKNNNDTKPSLSKDCDQVLNTTVEYMRLDKVLLGLGNQIPTFVKAVLEEADVLIMNLGLHYGNGDQWNSEKYREHLNLVFQGCGEINKNATTFAAARNGNNTKLCMFRDSFPQHFTHKNGTFPKDWELNFDDLVIGKCSRFQVNVHSQINWDKSELSSTYNVPVIPSPEALKDAWNWHQAGRARDCSHYCENSILWDLVHTKLVETWQAWENRQEQQQTTAMTALKN